MEDSGDEEEYAGVTIEHNAEGKVEGRIARAGSGRYTRYTTKSFGT